MDKSIQEEALKIYQLLSLDASDDENGRSRGSTRVVRRNGRRKTRNRINRKNKGRIRRRKP